MLRTKRSHFRFARKLVSLMDTKSNFFGIRFGIDPFFDLVPGIGDLVGAGISCYLFWIAYQYKVPRQVYLRMAWHIFLDYLMGLLPFLGFVFDLFYRANTKNLKLLIPFVDPDVLEGVVVEG